MGWASSSRTAVDLVRFAAEHVGDQLASPKRSREEPVSARSGRQDDRFAEVKTVTETSTITAGAAWLALSAATSQHPILAAQKSSSHHRQTVLLGNGAPATVL